ncbi:MAG: RNA polymerase sigma factor [Clostridiales bacterium]|nr:RNA polymerase sigma factor [Clostridiales bacterium]
MEDRALVRRARQGDAAAFGELYAKIYKKLYAYALYTLQNPSDAEDVVGEAVADAFASIGHLRREESFSSWMYRIVENKCSRRMREYYRDGGELTEEDENLREMQAEWNDDIDGTGEHIDVREAFAQLSEADRRIVGMQVIFGYRTREIAEIMGMNENTVRSREHRALKKLGEMLEG